MKKILFVTEHLQRGGIEKALYETIKLLKSQDVNLTIAVFVNKGDMLSDFSALCEVKDLSKDFKVSHFTFDSIIDDLKHMRVFSFCKKVFIRFYEKLFLTNSKKVFSRIEKMNTLNEAYDIAVAYHDPYSRYVPYVANKVNASKKYVWIHRDVNSTKGEDTTKEFDNAYSMFDQIICVSNSSAKAFISNHPNFAEKTTVIRNPIDINNIIAQSQEHANTQENSPCVKICSVGRLHIEKGFDYAIEACNRLTKQGYNIRWHVCGEGIARNRLETLINNYGISENFILLGNQANPYKYINASDIYVQPSRTESYCITLAEARALKKPIVTTNFPCASEHVIHEHNGFICEMTPESIADAIEKLILSPELREKFSNNTTPVDSDYTKLKQLFE